MMIKKNPSDTKQSEVKKPRATKANPKTTEPKLTVEQEFTQMFSESNPLNDQSKSTLTAASLSPSLTNATQNTDPKVAPKTRLIIKFDVGFNNFISIRGKGANLSWEKGIHLKNLKADEWVWEMNQPFTTCEFKVLINDTHYENGANHLLTCGTVTKYQPFFN